MSQVLLVDKNDQVIGQAEKVAAHQGGGQRHRAFSVLIVDGSGRMLLQKRSHHKPLWPLFWTNACCSHQTERGNDREQAEQRLQEELGFTVPLKFLFKLPYQREYQKNLSEHEITYVFLGKYGGKVAPDPQEVADYRWLGEVQLKKELEDKPDQFSPWFLHIIQRIRLDKRLTTQVWGTHGK